MLYYCSRFAPFSLKNLQDIKYLQTLANTITLLFLNDAMSELETTLYFAKIQEIHNIKIQYQQIDSQQLFDYWQNSTIYFDYSTAEFATAEHLVLKHDSYNNYCEQEFTKHLIFDDIEEDFAKYLMKNELFGITKQMVIVFNSMSYKRFKHTMRVRYYIKKLAEIHEYDVEMACFTALFHDYQKELPIEEQEVIMQKYFSMYMDAPIEAYHGFVGAYMLQLLYPDIHDDIFEAISFHTIGIEYLSILGLMLFIADYCEFGRPFIAKSSEVWQLAQSDLYAAARLKIEQMNEHLAVNGKPIYWTTAKMLLRLKEKIGVNMI